jgi:hypothetical protein
VGTGVVGRTYTIAHLGMARFAGGTVTTRDGFAGVLAALGGRATRVGGAVGTTADGRGFTV